MSSHRKQESGAKKRKLVEIKKERAKELLQKTPKLTNLWSSQPAVAATTSKDATVSDGQQPTTATTSEEITRDGVLQHLSATTSEGTRDGEESVGNVADEPVDSEAGAKMDISTDIACWGEVNEEIRSYWVGKGIEAPTQCQHKDADFSASERSYKNQKRCLSKTLFCRSLRNGEKVAREWLSYSPSTGNVFCFFCKLFSNDSSAFTHGFSDWKHSDRVEMHEAGQPHRKAVLTWLARTQVRGIDAGLQAQLKDETNYWKEVLRRVVAVIKFLSARGLAFRGENETLGSVHNGNYLGILELLAEFDPFLDEHLKRFGNKGRGTPSYLSSNICEEFIALMGQRVQSEIIMQLQHAKYFSLIVDSTPDLSHTDQLTFVVRYVSQEGKIFERFLKFLPIFSHTGESLFDSVLGVLQDLHIDIKNCRGQCFDNASNMAGAYKGLRARIQEINPLAEWIPCAAHSLNLVGVCSVDCCHDASSFFRLVQSIFTFFSASPSRWKILMDGLESNENKRMEVVKGLSSTRWAAHARATKALRLNFRNIHDTLNKIAEDENQKSAARDEAKSLAKKMNRFETAFLAIIWDTVLQRCEITSRALQTVELDLVTAVDLLQSLIDFVSNLRSQFKHLESQAKSLSLSQQYTVTRQVKRTTPADGTDEPTLVSNAGEDRFRETFFVIIDKLISALQQRHAVYKETSTYFGFLTQLDKLSLSEIREKSILLQAKYHEDLADDFPDELGQFVHFSRVSTVNRQPINLLAFIRERNLQHVFPNVDIALRIYLTLPVSNASGERSFSKLGIIKHKLRTTMLEERLNNLTLMSIEHDMLAQMDFEELINDFARKKSRRRAI